MAHDFIRTDKLPDGGSWLQGEIRVPFSRLVALFGEPDESDKYKVAFEWRILFGDGTIASIYDYKETSLYDDDLPSPAKLREGDFADWHVGGNAPRAYELVKEAIAKATTNGDPRP